MKLTNAALTLCLATAVAPLSARTGTDWNDVERLSPGSIIVVADDSGAAVRGRLLRADADSILLYAPTIDSTPFRVLDQMSQQQPRLLSRVDSVSLDLPDSNLRVGIDGISKSGVRIASFGQVFRASKRSAIMSVVRPKDQRHSYRGTIAGIAIGAGVGLFSGVGIGLSESPCQPHCGPREWAAGAAMAGGPILGGLIGHAISRPRQDAVIYRR